MSDVFQNLLPIDLVIVMAYMVGVLLIGIFYSRYVESAGDYFLAGRTLPFWAIGVSVVASDIGATDLIFGSGGTFKYGVSQFNFDWIGSMPALIIAAFVFVPYYWRAGVYTIPEFLGRRYNGAVRWIQALIWLIFMAVNVAIMLLAASTVLQEVLVLKEPWQQDAAIWVTALIVGLYTITGGLGAIVITDIMQVVVMLVGAGALVFLSVWEAGGIGGLVEKIQAQPDTSHFFHLMVPHSTPDSPYPWTGIVFGLGIVLSTAYFVGNQAVLQRVLGARSEWDAKAGMLVAGGLKFIIPLLMFVPGFAARALAPDLNDPDKSVPHMVNLLMPSGLKGLMFAAFFAALMSSVDSYLNSSVTVFLSDVYNKVHERLFGRGLSDRVALHLGRILTAALLVGAVLCAPYLKEGDRDKTIYEMIQTMLSMFQGPTLAILLLGIMWRRATGWGALAGLVSGVLLTGTLRIVGDKVFPSANPFLFIAFWSFVFSMAVTIVVSLLTRPEPPEKLRGLVYGQVLDDPEAQQLLRDHVEKA